ncbi:hypothetical protein [Mycobacterium sp. NPDC006124]
MPGAPERSAPTPTAADLGPPESWRSVHAIVAEPISTVWSAT